MVWVGECSECGARLANWMGGRHECMPPYPEWHPYINFLRPLIMNDDDDE